MGSGPSPLFFVFTAVTSIGVIIQAGVLLATFFGVRETSQRLMKMTEDLRAQIVPAVATSRHLLEDISPKLKVITNNLVEASNNLRVQSENLSSTVGDIAEKTRGQAERVDQMVTEALNGVEKAAEAVEKGVAGPLRQVSGVINGFKAAFDVLLKKDRKAHAAADEDMFV